MLAAAILPSGLAPQARLLRGVTSIAVLTVALAVASLISSAVDVSEDRRNSFNPADEAALTRMDQGLTITLHLTPEDSRALEYATNVLAKLKRIVPGLTVRWAETSKAGIFGAAQDEGYGRIVYDYAGRTATSRSNSPREILPILHELAVVQVTPVDLPTYSGYPLVADTRAAEVWFYIFLPSLILLIGWRRSRPGRLPVHFRNLYQGDLQ